MLASKARNPIYRMSDHRTMMTTSQSRQATSFAFARGVLAALWLSFVLLACNLGTSSAPPTLVPRATITPPPTLGYNMPVAAALPGSVQTPAAAQIDNALYESLNQVATDRLMSHVEALQGFYTRHVNSAQDSATRGIGAAARYIERQFNAIRDVSDGRLYTFPHEFELTYEGRTTRQRNLVAVIQGTEQGAGTVIVGAHYDSIGTPSDDPSVYAPGANDNATGVAALIELARIMSERQYRASIMFVAFSAEEVGRRGSIAFVDFLVAQNIDVSAMINVDTIGNKDDFDGAINDEEMRVFSQGPENGSLSRHLARMTEFIGLNQSLEIKLAVQDAIDRENRYGDHFSFEERGFPSIRFINAYEEKLNGDPTDTLDFVDAAYFRKNVQTLLVIVTSLADGVRPPRNLTLRDQGGGMKTLLWEPVNGAASYVVALRWPNSQIYNQQFEVTTTSVDWDKFDRYVGVAVAARDANGVVGPLSAEYRLR